MNEPHQKTLTLISRHYFSRYCRKTTVHFLARQFALQGYQVNFVTVGRSLLTCALKPKGKGLPADVSRWEFREIESGIRTIVMNEWIHPVSTGSALLRRLTKPQLLGYGHWIPAPVRQAVSNADIVMIECGYGVAYYPRLRALCPGAKFIYLATDPLSQVGLRKEIEDIEQRFINSFDLVRVAATELAERFPADTPVIEIPQGLDKSLFDAATESPYAPASKNIISVGDMSFDQEAITAMAAHNPEINFHIFGALLVGEYPSNIQVHGEVDFAALVPYIKFADVGLMPYRMSKHLSYLAKTSLKFLQYSYCGLPIVTPEGPSWNRDNMFYYQPGDKASITEALRQALRAPKDTRLADPIWDWRDCATVLLQKCQVA